VAPIIPRETRPPVHGELAGQAELMTDSEAASSRLVRKIVVRE
jgi:hypothetical protein